MTTMGRGIDLIWWWRCWRRRRGRARHASILCVVAAVVLACAVTLRHTLHWQRGRSKFERGGARIAYFIQVTLSNAGTFPALFKALFHCDNVHALHFDTKLESTLAETLFHNAVLLARSRCKCRATSDVVTRLPTEIVTYRGITMTFNYISGMAHILRNGFHFDFFINLSGADYPTASARVIRELLQDAMHDRLCFVEWKPRSTWKKFASRRLGHVYVDAALGQRSGNGSVYYADGGDDSNGKKNPLAEYADVEIAKSSGWWIFSREFVEYIVLHAEPRRLGALFSQSDASDEHYFATLLWNSEYFRPKAVHDNLRSIFFVAPNGSFALGRDGITRSRQHPFRMDAVDERGEYIFWEDMVQKPAFFARKFESPNSGMLKRIDREMIGDETAHTRDAKSTLEAERYTKRLRERFAELLREHRVQFKEELERSSPFRTAFITRPSQV